MWNAIGLVQDLNSSRRVHFPTTIGNLYDYSIIITVIIEEDKLILVSSNIHFLN